MTEMASNEQNNKFDSTWHETLPSSDYETFIYQLQSEIEKMQTALPVEVVAVSGTGTSPVGYVDVKPLVTQLTVAGSPVSQGLLTNVPYCRIQGGKNAFIVDPEVGDKGIAVFASRDISGVKNAKKESPPSSRRKYSINDAMYIGGILNAAPTQYVYIKPQNEIVIHATAKIVIEASQKIELNAPLIECHGNLTQTGHAGQTATFVGGITNTGGKLVSNNIVLEDHVHDKVQSGSSNTGKPVG